jgi:hypothetical protein
MILNYLFLLLFEAINLIAKLSIKQKQNLAKN